MMCTENIIATAVALTTSATASTKTVKCKSADKHSVYLLWTPGTTNNVLTVTVETSPDGTKWVQDMTTTNASGVLSRQALSFTHTATGTTEVGFRLDLTDIQAEELRVKYAESEAGSSTKGTITVKVLSRSCCC